MILVGWLTVAAMAGEPVSWTRDPALLPWETLVALDDGSRQIARSIPEIEARRATARARLESDLSAAERAAALAEMGDLFRDEARMVLEADATDPWRVRLPTSPAWLQIEIALRWYEEALRVAPEADVGGRLTLLRSVLGTRLGLVSGPEDPRPWRGTPWVEAARLAVADRDAREGDVPEARSGYKTVRDSKDLASYAQYRLAGLLAADGEGDRARQMLEALAEDRRPGPFTAMLRDAARSALANHQAADRGLVQVIPWIDEICPPGDVACRRELRQAAADTWRKAGDARSEAWLRTVDAADPLEGNPAARLDLARRMVGGLPAYDLVMAAEGACSGPDGREVRPGCRAEMAMAVGNFHDQAGDPSGSWIQGYARLPRLDREDVQRAVAMMVRQPGPPDRELATFDALCAAKDAACTTRMHTHLRAVWSRLDRVHDAAWLHFVDSPPPWPGIDEEIARGLVRTRAPARLLLGATPPTCAQDAACEAEAYPLMVGYYAAIGQDAEAAWLIALQGVDELPLSEAARGALRSAAMRGAGGADMARAVIRTCPAYTLSCFATSRVAAEAFLRAAQRTPEANEAAKFGVLSDFRLPEPAWAPLIETLVADLDAAAALPKIAVACGPDPGCAVVARAALAAWYAEIGRPEQERIVLAVDRTLDLGTWEPLRDRLLRVLHTAPDEATALGRVPDLCPVGSGDCQAVLGEAIRDWYQVGRAYGP